LQLNATINTLNFQIIHEAMVMKWEVCIRFSNGQERALRWCKDREIALRYVDAIYAQGYPMHVAYIVRPAAILESLQSEPLPLLGIRC
jgi:hypothetical protein